MFSGKDSAICKAIATRGKELLSKVADRATAIREGKPCEGYLHLWE